MSVHRAHQWLLDDATRDSGIALLDAAGGLPRRVAPQKEPSACVLALSPTAYWRLSETAIGYGQYDDLGGGGYHAYLNHYTYPQPTTGIGRQGDTKSAALIGVAPSSMQQFNVVLWDGAAYFAGGPAIGTSDWLLLKSTADGYGPWTPVTVNKAGLTPAYISGLAYGNGIWLASTRGVNTPYLRSTDGSTFTAMTGGGGEAYALSFANGYFFAEPYGVGFSGPRRSADGLSWTNINVGIGTNIYWWWVGYGNGLYVLLCQNPNTLAGYIYTSPDMVTWTNRTPGLLGNFGLYEVVWNGSRFVAVGDNGKVCYSDDGLTWTVVTVNLGGAAFYSVCWTGTKWVATANGRRYAYSADGVTWTAQYFPGYDGDTGESVATSGTSVVSVGSGSYHIYTAPPDTLYFSYQYEYLGPHVGGSAALTAIGVSHNTPFTVAAWVKVPETPQSQAKVIAGTMWGGPNNYITVGGWRTQGWELDLTSDARLGIYLSCNTASWCLSPSQRGLSDGKWHHVAVTVASTGWSGATVKFYIDGALVAGTLAYSGTRPTSMSMVGSPYVACAARGNTESASVQDVAFWKNRELNATEVASLLAEDNIGKARFAKAFAANATVRGLLLPGNDFISKAASKWGRRAWLSTDGVTRTEVDPDADPAYAVTAGQTLYVDIEFRHFWNLGTTPTPYIATALGGGPTLVYEEADPPLPALDITAISSSDGIVDVVLSSSIGSIAAPTSDPVPAVQILSATQPAAGTLRLSVGPAYPAPGAANVTSIRSRSGFFEVVLSQTIGSVAVPTNDADAPLRLQAASAVDTTLTVTHEHECPPPTPTAGDADYDQVGPPQVEGSVIDESYDPPPPTPEGSATPI